MKYKIYPIGEHLESGVPGVAFPRIRSPRVTSTDAPSASIWGTDLFQAREGQLRHPSNLITADGSDRIEMSMVATCPAVGGVFRTSIDMVHTTGLIDEYGTPTDSSDDQPELEVVTMPVWLDCGSPFMQLTGYGYRGGIDISGGIRTANGQYLQWGAIFQNFMISQSIIDFSKGKVLSGPTNVVVKSERLDLKANGTVWTNYTGIPFSECSQIEPPRQVEGLSGVTRIIDLGINVIALQSDGTVKMVYPRLDNVCEQPKIADFEQLDGLTNIVDVSYSKCGAFYVDQAGKVFTIRNTTVKGYFADENRSVEIVERLTGIASIRLSRVDGGCIGFALGLDGKVFSLRFPLATLPTAYGFGDPPTASELSKLEISDTTLSNVVSIKSSEIVGFTEPLPSSDFFALGADGSLWNLAIDEPLSMSAFSPTPTKVVGAGPFASMNVFTNQNLGVKSNGSVYLWGTGEPNNTFNYRGIHQNLYTNCLEGRFTVLHYRNNLFDPVTGCPTEFVRRIVEPKLVNGINIF
jgi:hypothetical protein